MKRWIVLLGAGVLIANTAAAQGPALMPTNPFGTMFAPWNSLPGGFSPLNNGFTSGGPMGMSPFAMSPFGSNGSPWGSMPSTMMPWNAWSSSPGSIVPWGNQMPFGNFSNFSNNGNGMPMPWGNNFNPWTSWQGNNLNNLRNQNRNNRERDALRTLLLMQELNGGRNAGGILPGLPGLPPLPGSVMPSPVTPGAPPAVTANSRTPPPPQPVQGGFTVPPAPRQFDPFASPAPPQQPLLPALPVRPASPQQPTQRFVNPFIDSAPVGVTDPSGNSGMNPSAGNAANNFNPFAGDAVQPNTGGQPNGLKFPEQDLFK